MGARDKHVTRKVQGAWHFGALYLEKAPAVPCKMAATTYKQDMAPKGGYPEINYVRNLPKRGPPGWAIMLGGVAVMSFGFLVVARANQRRRYMCMYESVHVFGVDDITVCVCIPV